MPLFKNRHTSYWKARIKRGEVRPTLDLVKKHARKFDELVITIGALHKNYSGRMYPDLDWMCIHHRKLNPLVRVIIHEYLHDIFPHKGENWILRWEMRLMREITIKDKLYFLLDLSNKLVLPGTSSKKRLKTSLGR